MIEKSALFLEHGIEHGFCDRYGGVSLPPFNTFNFALKKGASQDNIATNRALLCKRLNVAPENLFLLKQVSGNQCYVVQEQDTADSVAKVSADALVTTRKAIALGIVTADCLPVLFYDLSKSIGASVHVGWSGLAQGVIEATAQVITELGGSMTNSIMATGPAISKSRLRLAGKAASDFLSRDDLKGAVSRDGEGVFVDLAHGARLIATNLGVNKKNIDILGGCTAEEGSRWFSYRRDGARTGCQISVIKTPNKR